MALQLKCPQCGADFVAYIVNDGRASSVECPTPDCKTWVPVEPPKVKTFSEVYDENARRRGQYED